MTANDGMRAKPGEGSLFDALRVKNEGNDFTHLPSPISTVLTLCGFVDVAYEEVEADEITCPGCLKVVRYARLLPRSIK